MSFLSPALRASASWTRSGTAVPTSRSLYSLLSSKRTPDRFSSLSRSVRSAVLPAVSEYAAFALAPSDAVALEVGDAVLLPELGTAPARLIADGRFVIDENGVSRYNAGELVHVVDATPRDVTLGELFDAAEAPRTVEAKPTGALKLVEKGKTLATGHLDRLGDQPAFIVETPST